MTRLNSNRPLSLTRGALLAALLAACGGDDADAVPTDLPEVASFDHEHATD